MNQLNRIILAGGTGFLGKILRRHFSAAGHEMVVLTRSPSSSGEVQWDGRTLGPWTRELEGALALINLAGKSVNCRYNELNRKLIMGSRVESTRVLGEAVARCANPPRIWLNSSTATIYKHSLDRDRDEASTEFDATPEARDAFSVSVARNWEDTFFQARAPQTRKIALRTSMVLGTEPGTVFRVLERLTRLGLGGRMGSGEQYVAWIHETDFCHAVQWLISNEKLAGPINMTAPVPIPNARTMAILRRECGMPLGLPATRWMLHLGAIVMRTETELILKSRRVVPKRLIDSGFTFRFPTFEDAAHDLTEQLKAQQKKPPE